MRTTLRRAPTRKPKWTPGSDGKYHCPVCNEEFDRPAGLGRHFAHAHKGEPTNGMAPPGPVRVDAGGPVPGVPEAGELRTVRVFPPLSPEAASRRAVCDAVVTILMLPEWRKLSLVEQRDALAVVRSRIFAEAGMAENLLTGDTATATMPA